MCVVFFNNSSDDPDSDYMFIVASNRDESYDRPTQNMAPWKEDPGVIGGRDLEAGNEGGTWLAMSVAKKKIGVLLNLPNSKKPDAKTRGKLVADFVKSDASATEYVESMKEYAKQCNTFVLVTVELGQHPRIQSYSNASETLDVWNDTILGFSNSLPNTPLQKVSMGKQEISDICSRYKKVSQKEQLVSELIGFLKSKTRYLPDEMLSRNVPEHLYQEFSSVCVCIPEMRYGTRTHTLILITKTGEVDMIEFTIKAPVDFNNPVWERTEQHFTMKSNI